MPSNQGPSELTEEGRESLTDFLFDAAEFGLSESFYAATDFPGFVADDSQTAPHLALGRAITRLSCRRWARGEAPQNLPGFDAAWGSICEPYLDSLGEWPGDGTLAPPFRGGQCPVSYNATWEQRTYNGNTLSYEWVPRSYTGGALLGPVTVDAGPGVGGCPSGTSESTETLRGSNGTAVLIGFGGCSDVSPGYRNLVLTRADGQSDNCGSVPPLYDPAPPRPGLPSIPRTPVRIPGIGPVDIDVTFDPDGNINVDLPDIGVGVELPNPFDGPGDGGDGGGGGGGPAPGDDGQPGGGVTAAPGEDAEGEAPPGQVLVGLKMNMTTIPESAREYAAGRYRGAAYIYMGGSAGLDQDFAGSILEDGQFVYAEKDNLTRWRVRANNGFVFNVVPYYREAE